MQGASGIVIAGPVPFDGHILVFGPVSSVEGLFSMLAPLRSKRLARWRPIVILDTTLPEPGTGWDDISRLKDGSAHSAADLLRANAERAARGILLPKFDLVQDEDAALEAAAMSDGETIETWQQLKTINPHIELHTEMVMAADMAYLYPATPIPGVRLMQVGLSPAYMAGSVFVAYCLDSLAIQAYTNHGAHKIVLKLMHQWHSGDPRLLSRSMGRAAGWRATSLLVRGSGGGAARGQDSDPESPRSATDGGDEPPAPLPRDGRQEKDQSPLPPPPPRPPPAAPREPRGGAPPKGAAREKRGAQQQAEVLHAPTVVLVHIEAPWTEGWSYGAYWHDLLHHQSMLALGLYRPVRQQGVQFDCVTTHPCPDTPLRPGDRAFVIANLDFAAAAGNGGSVWPAGSLGFDHDLSAEEFAEFEAAAAALLRRHGGPVGGGGGGDGFGAGAAGAWQGPAAAAAATGASGGGDRGRGDELASGSDSDAARLWAGVGWDPLGSEGHASTLQGDISDLPAGGAGARIEVAGGAGRERPRGSGHGSVRFSDAGAGSGIGGAGGGGRGTRPSESGSGARSEPRSSAAAGSGDSALGGALSAQNGRPRGGVLDVAGRV
ncbi:hypothetical protein MNEG_1770 [Monoraphidium neglectum]|uniref:RCK N-terminal domain-containing protein n=1 Tax=Monoraphidium neglectum TaxID=145388 RepID=A0A0D2N107_9CHLO|nr:hypothetical protein MNEG_1770 [Monoraphidium neglectum]KIZ06192.1 hypothetical protein MNEG_1770 [Monoraphidium neglectum]|eukprot:XP_013905211.1 hypothetical protein MNEG_1770 [Monoraphidium neglectum]